MTLDIRQGLNGTLDAAEDAEHETRRWTGRCTLNRPLQTKRCTLDGTVDNGQHNGPWTLNRTPDLRRLNLEVCTRHYAGRWTMDAARSPDGDAELGIEQHAGHSMAC